MEDASRSLDEYLLNGNVSFFGYTKRALPDIARKARNGRTRVFVKEGRQKPTGKESVPVARYERLSDIRDEHSDVYFLDHEAVKVLFAEFPVGARYVLVRLVPRISWFVGLPGLLRRIQLGLVSVEGIRSFSAGEGTQQWLVIRHNRAEALHTRLCLSKEVGIQGLLTYLAKENLEYVILRFFEKLPELHREGGDLDILVLDESERAVKEFLKAHPGPVGVDVWTVSRVSHNAITYFPPPIARKILGSKMPGPAGAFVPSPRESFLSFAYHVLYHKGLFAGVKTTLPGLTVNAEPENDYAGELKTLAEHAGIDVEITMESLDEYLGDVGWRPQLDTLAKIAPRNKWVWQRFFSATPTKEIGLGVFILKQKALELGLTDKILATIGEYEGFEILRTRTFEGEEVQRIADSLRGGVWNDVNGTVRDYLPALAVVVLDTHLARASKLHATHESKDHGIKHLKKMLRKNFDTEKTSLTHATDYTHEAWEYIEVCFPEAAKQIQLEVEKHLDAIPVSLVEQIQFFFAFLPRYIVYRVTRARQWFRSALVRFVMEK